MKTIVDKKIRGGGGKPRAQYIKQLIYGSYNLLIILFNYNFFVKFIKNCINKDVLIKNAKATMACIRNGIKFEVEEDSKMLIAILKHSEHDIKLYPKNKFDLAMLNEKFVLQDYNFSVNGDAVVFDIGMNTGIATLYFAAKPNVKSIYSFELFEPTYDVAVKNFELNPELNKKINAYNFGLSNTEERIDCFYSAKHSSACGIDDVRGFDNDLNDVLKIECSIKKASDVIGNIYNQEIRTNKKKIYLVLKIDVEGAEYDIFDDLNKINFLSSVDIVMMEYHKGKEILINQLASHGFIGVSFVHGTFGEHNERGMIYMFKVAKNDF